MQKIAVLLKIKLCTVLAYSPPVQRETEGHVTLNSCREILQSRAIFPAFICPDINRYHSVQSERAICNFYIITHGTTRCLLGEDLPRKTLQAMFPKHFNFQPLIGSHTLVIS